MDTPFSDSCAERVKAGDPDAIGEVYSVMADRLLGYLVARIRDRQIAEDLLEQVFIKLIRKGHAISGDAIAMKVWLFRVAYTTAMDHLRKVSRRPECMVGDFGDMNVASLEDGPVDSVLREENRATVRAAMAHLSEDQRTVLELRYIAGLGAREIAETLGKTEGAIRSLQHRGERAMHRMLTDVLSSEQLPKSNP
ncbi:RNA polymerase sigma factor [Stomatohabitans albus]|uniref:RNA polymerase sigma factor n=1 Tax=Stomatohabitans albus TaxID=3110766 RepID=UPI00300CBFF9